MLSANNILSPASGRPIVTPSQDLIIGGYYLTESIDDAKGAGRVFRHLWEVLRAYEEGALDLHALIKVRKPGEEEFETTAGRALLEEALPQHLDAADGSVVQESYTEKFGHIDFLITKKEMGVLVEHLSDHYSKAEVAKALDHVKDLCYRYATQSGITVSIDDVRTPKIKRQLLDGYEAQADKVETQFRRGIITDGERRQQEVRIWTDATAEVQAAMEKEFKEAQFNPIDMMVGSGARGNMTQMRQIAGMRGLVANPRGDMIPRPIKSNFREGLETLEYFIATPGARKGLVDTALRTADSGYLTRRLVDVAQELIVREEDCGSTLGVWIENVAPDTANTRSYLETKLYGRALLQDTDLAEPMEDGRKKLRAQHHRRRQGDGSAARRPEHLPPAGPFGAHVRCRARRVRDVLRPFARDRQDDRTRRGRRCHRRPVDRRTRHAADDAHVPHRWCGRQGHRRWSAPRRRTVRGSHPEGFGPSGQGQRRAAPARGRGQGHPGRRRRRRRRGARSRAAARCSSDRRGRPGRQGRRPARRWSLRSEGDHGDQGHPRDAALPRRGSPAGLPRPGRVDPRQAHRADRASDDAPDRRAGAGRLRLPARRARRLEAFPRHEPSHGRRERSDPPRAAPSSWASPRPRWPPSRGCRLPRSRRPPGCSPRPPSTVAATA